MARQSMPASDVCGSSESQSDITGCLACFLFTLRLITRLNMIQLKPLFISIAMLSTACISALAQTLPTQSSEQKEAQALLQKVAEASRALKSYHFEGTQLSESKGEYTFSRTEMKFVWAGEQPNKFRLETKTPSSMRMATISDGQTRWIYQGRFKQFTKQAQIPGAPA